MATLNPVVFLKEVKVELAQVVWPTKNETIRLTGVVIFISVVVGIILGTADFLLTKVMAVIIK